QERCHPLHGDFHEARRGTLRSDPRSQRPLAPCVHDAAITMTSSHGIPILVCLMRLRCYCREESEKGYQVKTKRIHPVWKVMATGIGLYALIAAIGCSKESGNEKE